MSIDAIRQDSSREPWEVAGPAGAGVLELPTLPGSFAAYNLSSSTVGAGRLYLRRIPGGWDSVRVCALSPDCLFPPHAQGDYSVASGPNGVYP